MNINFKKKSLMLLSGVGGMVNKFSLDKRNYPLLIGCGEHDFDLAIEVNRQWAKKENLEPVIISNAVIVAIWITRKILINKWNIFG